MTGATQTIDATSYARGVADERERCLRAVAGERLTDGTLQPYDAAYNIAINHAIAAIKRGQE